MIAAEPEKIPEPAATEDNIDDLRRQMKEMQDASSACRKSRRKKSEAERPTTGVSPPPATPNSSASATGDPRMRARSGAPGLVTAPCLQHGRRLVVLNPFRDRLDLQPARQVDQRLHEGAVIGRARDVLHEGAIDLDNIDAELAQIPERV